MMRMKKSPRDFYPRPPRGGRRVQPLKIAHLVLISIHALREEGDGWWSGHIRGRGNFYPRPPRGGRRQERYRGADQDFISIHALREEGDYGVCFKIGETGISIHALREEGDERGGEPL